YPQAMPLQEAALETRRRVLGDDDPSTRTSIGNMGALLKSMGKYDEALPFEEQALEGRRRVLGDDHPKTLASINNMAGLLRSMGKLDEALPCFEEVLEGNRRVLGDDHPETLASINNMGSMLQKTGKLDEALPYYEEALDGRRRVLGDDHANTLISIASMGGLLFEQGKPEEAIALLEPAEAKAHQALTGAWLRAFLTALGRSRTATEAFAAAETNLTESWTILNSAENAKVKDREKTLTRLVELYEAWDAAEPGAGHDGNAAEWRAKLAEPQAETPEK
ncbi:tetratricopeptide repeat protein, partial [bacterium]|nr:tetratricopeptide repeat protein [bacterium]